MSDENKNLCLAFPMAKVNKPYHLEIDGDGNILYPECEKINGVNIVKQPRVAFEQLEKMLQGGLKRDELVCITATSSENNHIIGKHIDKLYPILQQLANTGKALVFDNKQDRFIIKDTVTDVTLEHLELVENDNKEVQIVRVKSRHNSLANLDFIPHKSNLKNDIKWFKGILKHPDKHDPYWQIISTKDEQEIAIVYNQNQFKKFCRKTLCTDNRYNLDEISNPKYMWWSERFPISYPCKVQFWSHFEGSMLFLAIEYINKEQI